MGYYIQTDSPKAKANALIAEHGAILLDKAPKWADIPTDKAVICVVDNGPFEAAALAYSADELEVFSSPDPRRRRQWLYMDKTTAHKLSGYK